MRLILLLGVALTYIKMLKFAHLLFKIQNDLFDVSADLCLPESNELDYKPLRITDKQVEYFRKANRLLQ